MGTEATENTPQTGPALQLEAFKGFLADSLKVTKDRIDEMDGKIEEAILDLVKVKALPEEVGQQLQKLGDRLDAAEASVNGLPPAGGEQQTELGKAIAGSKYLSAGRENDGRAFGKINPGKPGLMVPSLSKSRRLEKVTIDTSALARPREYRPGIVDYSLLATRIMDRVPKVDLAERTYYFIKESRTSGEGGVVTTADGAITGGAAATIKFLSVGNLMVGSLVVIKRTDGAGTLLGYETAEVLSFDTGTRVVTMTATIAGNVADGDKINFTPYAATAESAQKPYTYLETEEDSVPVQTIALLAKLTRQALADNAQLESWIQTKMARSNARNVSRHLLYGTGTTGQLQGFLALSTRQTSLWSAGTTGESMADYVLRSALAIPDDDATLELTIKREDWHSMITEKGNDGHYIYGPDKPIMVINTPGLKAIGNMIAFTEAMLKNNGDFMIAEHGQASELGLKGVASFLFGFMGDQFGTNEITARYEEDMAHAILSEQWYVHGKFDSRP